MGEQKILTILRGMVDGWGAVMVRVRQDGKMGFRPLSTVTDERLAAKIALDLIKQAAREEGLLGRRPAGVSDALLGDEREEALLDR